MFTGLEHVSMKKKVKYKYLDENEMLSKFMHAAPGKNCKIEEYNSK